VPAHEDDEIEDEPFAEIKAAHETARSTLIAVPTELIPAVRALIARRAGA
jgi:hypothetical protein